MAERFAGNGGSMTPSSAAKLGLNLTLAMSASESALQRHLRANYSAGVADADAGEVEKPEREANEVEKLRDRVGGDLNHFE